MLNKMLAFLLACALVLVCGGKSVRAEWPKLWSGKPQPPKVKESKYPNPVKIAVIWSPAVYNQVGKPSTRGFGGRIYFYDAKNDPVAVEGQLVVYAYNDNGPGAENRTPERKFAFSPEQFTQHFSPTQLGASYSIWIPWDAVGSPQAQLTLIPIFTSASGQLVIGESSHNLLPGPNAPTGEVQYGQAVLPPSPLIRPDPSILNNNNSGQLPPGKANNYEVQQASFSQGSPAGGQPQQPTGPTTTSINLTGSLADRLVNAAPQGSPMERLAMQQATFAANKLGANGAVPVAAAASQPAANPAGATTSPIALQKAQWQTAAPPPWMVPPPARSAPQGLQAPASPAPQPIAGQLPTTLFPAAQPSAPPSTR